MSHPAGPPPLSEARRRLLIQFARWHTLVADSDEATRGTVEACCRRLDLGGLSDGESLGLTDALDEILESLLADVVARGPHIPEG